MLHQPAMNQSASIKDIRTDTGMFLRPPFDSWTPDMVLEYFHTRQSIKYFPVVDEMETSQEKLDHILQNRFEFNHQIYHRPTPLDWLHNPSTDREWLFMLHKFYYGVGLGRLCYETQDHRYAEKWIDLTDSWIDTVPLDFLPSRVAGRRIQNWIYAHYYFVSLPETSILPPMFYARFLESLHHQVVHLTTHLDKARNHRTLELSAIFLAAVVFPEFQQSEHWLALAKQELQQNLKEDLLTDGVHCELSTEYHHLVLKNYLTVMRLAHLNHITMPESMHRQIQQALDFALHVPKPDGDIPAISDGDVESYLHLLHQGYQLYGDESWEYVATKGTRGQPPAARSRGFSESGYYILRSGWGNGLEPYEDERYLLFDCGPLGEGNHGHFDLLNIEVAAYGQSLIVDPGRYTYDETGETNWRARFRETASHNTVLVDGKNQTAYKPGAHKYEVQGPYPEYTLQTFVTTKNFDYLHGIVKSAEYPVVHERKITFLCPDYWIISDVLIAQDVHQYDLLFHLSTQAQDKITAKVGQGTLLIQSPHLLLAQPLDPETKLSVESGYLSPRYGLKHSAPIVRFSQKGSIVSYHTILYPYQHTPPSLSIQEFPVSCDGKPCPRSHASALAITRVDDHGRQCRDYYFVRNMEKEAVYRFGNWTCQDAVLVIRTDSEGRIVSKHSV